MPGRKKTKTYRMGGGRMKSKMMRMGGGRINSICYKDGVKSGTMTLAQVRAAAKKKGYKLVKV